jgi:hypothetical protein
MHSRHSCDVIYAGLMLVNGWKLKIWDNMLGKLSTSAQLGRQPNN